MRTDSQVRIRAGGGAGNGGEMCHLRGGATHILLVVVAMGIKNPVLP